MKSGLVSSPADGWLDFQLRVSALVMASWAAALASLHFTNSRIDGPHLVETARSSLVICSPLILLVALYRWLPYLSRCAALLIWAWVVNIAFEVPILAAARFRLPLRDGALSWLDGAIGISVASISAWTRHHELIQRFNLATYASLRLFCLSALLLCLCRRRPSSAQRLILASAYALAVVALVSTFLPCIGPWYNLAFIPLPNQFSCAGTLSSLRAAGPIALGTQDARIVCFPSFHVSLAILTALALRRVSRTASVVGTVWAILISLSTIFLGWHYASDVVAGAVLAATCFYATRPLERQTV
jgi:membrane-associated phospholipid phosphatase